MKFIKISKKLTPENTNEINKALNAARHKNLYGVKLGNLARDKDFTVRDIAEYMGVSEYVVVYWFAGFIGMSKPYIEKTKELMRKLR